MNIKTCRYTTSVLPTFLSVHRELYYDDTCSSVNNFKLERSLCLQLRTINNEYLVYSDSELDEKESPLYSKENEKKTFQLERDNTFIHHIKFKIINLLNGSGRGTTTATT